MLSGLKKFFGQGHDGKTVSIIPGAVTESLNRSVERPQTSESELLVHELIPVTRENWPYVQRVMKKAVWQGGDSDLEAIFSLHAENKNANGSFVACDNSKYPVLINNNQTRIQMWKRRGMDPTGENLLFVQSQVIGTAGQVITFLPQQLVRGPKASFIMVFRMSCCETGSYSALVSLTDKTGEKSLCALIDSERGGIREGMGSNVFRNRIGVATTAEGRKKLEETYEYIDSFYKTNGIPAPQ